MHTPSLAYQVNYNISSLISVSAYRAGNTVTWKRTTGINNAAKQARKKTQRREESDKGNRGKEKVRTPNAAGTESSVCVCVCVCVCANMR